MGSHVFKLSRARVLAIALGMGIAGSLATAPASLAAGAGPKPPAIGQNCQADGKINGAGSTFQTNGMLAGLIYGYEQDVCGPAPISSNLNSFYNSNGGDPSIGTFGGAGETEPVSGMLSYNIAFSPTNSETNGSGAGLNRMSCRTDFFAGTDLPYNNSQLTDLDSTPGQLLTDESSTCGAKINTSAFPSPFGPAASSYPNTSDASASIMGMPIAAGAVALATNLTGMCTNGTPTGLNLTADEFDKIMQGVINQWDDNELVATNPILGPTQDNCTGAITRVVRQDNSGTTSITMNDLYGVDPNALCSTTHGNWYAIGTSSNNSGQWPTGTGCAEGNPAYTWDDAGTTTTNQSTANPNAAAGPAQTATSSGSPALIQKVYSTDGSIGYAETGLWGTLPAGVSFANLQTYSDEQTAGNGLSNPNPTADANGNAAFINAGSAGAKSKCQLPAGPPTGSSALDAVGLGSTTWSNSVNGTTPGDQDVAWSSEGSGYPLCGLTFDLVYTGSQNETGEIAAPTSSAVATPGCTVTAPASTTTTGTSVAGTLTVVSTTGYPTAGTIDVGGTNYAYTGLTSTSFTGSAIPAGIAASTPVSLFSTTVAQTATAVGVNGACESVQGPLQGSTNDQLRTLYSFFTYVFSPLAQNALGTTDNYLPKQTLDPLPQGWLGALTQGFQQNF